MTSQRHAARLNLCLAENRSGVTSLLFAIMMVPLILILGIAIDFGFYIDASSKLNLAADAAAMHAVRAASMAASNNAPSYQIAGTQAGYDWFAAQAGAVTEVTLDKTTALSGTDETGKVPVSVTVSYTAPTYSATVTYSGTINIIFSKLVGIKTWPIAGTATSTITYSFVDFGIMIDNSQSMLIGATQADINTMNLNTPCARVTPTAQGTYPGLSMINYAYYLNGLAYQPQLSQGPAQGTNYGYGYYTNANKPPQFGPETLPPVGGPVANMFCDPNLIGGCAYPPSVIYGGPTQPLLQKTTVGSLPAGACNNGGGSPGTQRMPAALGRYTPQAPCAFACHENANGGDWYAEARNLGVTLRLDVVQKAAQQLLTTMQTYGKPPQTLLNVGIYTFNSTFEPVYPCSNSGCQQFGDDLKSASDILNVCTGTQTTGCLLPPVTGDNPNTDIPDVFAEATTFLKGSKGDGLSQATALKNLFIITDGVSDWPAGGQPQMVGPIDQLVQNPCQQLKDQGFTIYVLYTPYQPLPTWTYSYYKQVASPVGTYPYGSTLQNFVTEPAPNTNSQVEAALQACATNPTGYYKADDAKDITAALNAMLATALNSAARVTN